MITRCLKCSKYLVAITEHCRYCNTRRNIPGEEEKERRMLLSFISRIIITTIITLSAILYMTDLAIRTDHIIAVGLTLTSLFIRRESGIIINHSGYTRQEKNAALRQAIISSLTAWAFTLLLFTIETADRTFDLFKSI